MTDRSLADVTETLFDEFDGRLQLTTIVHTVRRVKREVEIARGVTPIGVIERIARRRLADIADSDPTPVG